MEKMTIRDVGQRQRLLEWSRKVADCRQSGLSVKRWCAENGTNVKSYYSWQKKVFEAMVEEQELRLEEIQSTETSFIELPAPQQAMQTYVAQTAAAPIATVRSGTTSVDVYPGADPAVVAALCQVLKQC